jgi:nanoRNase/pAp phosphatase (c-di-AMP/oligoRNAs hydrolase)
MVFGDEIKQYPMVCLFYYDGRAHLWKYSLYSDAETGADVEKIATAHGGGGHIHASGFHSDELILK